jgi:CIC family chloride channel protein
MAQDVPPAGDGTRPAPEATVGPVTGRLDPQALFASESLGQALRQLEVYGRDGLPVLSADGRQVQGWVTSASLLRALARQISGAPDDVVRAQAAASGQQSDAEAMLRHPPAQLPGYQLIEITIPGSSRAAGCTLADVAWPPGSTPVSVLHGRRLHAPDPGLTLATGDRVSLLIPDGQPARHLAGETATPVAD